MGLTFLTLSVLLLIGGVLPRQIRHKRAVSPHQVSPLSKNDVVKGDNSAVVKLCPPGQLEHRNSTDNSTVCCLPTACQPGHVIVRCSADGEEDRCERCPRGEVQPKYVTSSDTTPPTCFKHNESMHSQCPRGESIASSGMHSMKCPYWCECDVSRCYHGDPCMCSTLPQCGVNEEMDPETKQCRPCPPYAFKSVTGCQRCEINVTLWREGVANAKVVTKKPTRPTTAAATNMTSPGKPNTKDPVGDLSDLQVESKEEAGDPSKDNHLMTIVVVLLSVLVLVAVLALFLKMRGSNGQSSMLISISAVVSRCLPNKTRIPHTTTESTMTTPVSENTVLIESQEPADVARTPDTELLQMSGDGTRQPRMPPTSLETVYIRGALPGILRQNSVQVDAQVHSSSSSGGSSIGSSPDLTGVNEEITVLGASGHPATAHRELPGGTSVAIPAQGTSLVRAQNQESVDTGIYTGTSTGQSGTGNVLPQEMKRFQSVQPRGEMVSDDVVSPNATRGASPESIGQRRVEGQSVAGTRPSLVIPRPGTVTGALTDQQSVGHEPITPSSARIILPAGPNAAQNGPVARIQPFQPQPHVMRHHSGPQYQEYMADSSGVASSYYQVDPGHMSDFTTGDCRSWSDVPSVPAGPSGHLAVHRYGRSEPEGASERNSPGHNDDYLDEDRQQTERKEIAPLVDVSGDETSPKYVDTDNTSPKTINTEPDYDVDRLKADGKFEFIGVNKEGAASDVIDIDKDSSSVAGVGKPVVRTDNQSAVMQPEHNAVLMENLKTREEEPDHVDMNERNRGRLVIGGNICDNDDESFEIPNSAIVTDLSESFELPNDVLENCEEPESDVV